MKATHYPNIFLLTGPIRSGKTTRLRQWLENQPRASGLLSPDREGRRWFYDFGEKEFFPAEAEADEAETLTIGRFVFSQTAFQKARAVLLDALQREPDWLAVDEVGPLELAGKGLEPALSRVIDSFKNQPGHGSLILVVRDSLLEKVIEKFGLMAM